MRAYRFFAHFNRNNMQRGDPRVWTLHLRGQCFPVESIDFGVQVKTDYKPQGKQPRATLRGACRVALFSSDDRRVILR